MAYMSQENKKELAPGIRKVLKKYNMKGTIAVRNLSALVVNVKSGPLDFNLGHPGYLQANHYWFDENYEGKALKFLKELYTAMSIGNHDRSDIQTDYFDVGWYIEINLGKWDKLYEVVR